jgi:hypothetical protein
MIASLRGHTVLLPVVLAVLATGCGVRPCDGLGDTKVEQLVAQLEGRCCGFHTEPTEERLDASCKLHDRSTGGLQLAAGQHTCVKWAAECLAQEGPAAREAVPALIASLESGPNNYDTGDGIIPTRDAVVRALGATGDPRAIEPLLEALHNPRPVDAGPGAAGYASKEPVGEAVALEALGLIGPPAAATVPEIIAYLRRPITTDRDEWRHREATMALARIADPAGLPVLIETLVDPRRIPGTARALAEWGPEAAAAVPALTAAVEARPDAEGNSVLRTAIFRIAGKQAYRALPANYSDTMNAMWRLLDRRAKAHVCQREGVHLNGPAGELTQKLGGGVELRVSFPERGWVADRRAAGTLLIVTPAGQDGPHSFGCMEELEELADDILRRLCGR